MAENTLKIPPKCSKLDGFFQKFSGPVAPYPTWGAYSAPQTPSCEDSLRFVYSLRSWFASLTFLASLAPTSQKTVTPHLILGLTIY